MVYHRGGTDCWYVSVPTRHGRVKRSTGTTHRPTAKARQRAIEALGPDGARGCDLLDRVADGSLALPVLFDAYSRNDVDGLRARLDDVDLAVHVDRWAAWLVDRVKPTTAERYVTHVRTLMPAGEPFQRSAFTAPAIAQWLATRTALGQKRRPSATASRRKDDPAPRPVSGASKRKYLAAVQSFAQYLVEMGVLAGNPLRDVRAPRANAPRANAPRCQFLELPDVLRLVEGAQKPYRAVFTLVYGAGLEVSAILALVEADVDVARRQVRARGTKAWTRDRIARVADWAWPHVTAHLATLLPGERLSRGVTRCAAGDVHRDRLHTFGLSTTACTTAGIIGPCAWSAPGCRSNSSRGS